MRILRVIHGNVKIEVPPPAWGYGFNVLPRYDPRHRLLFREYLSRLPVSPADELEKERGD